MIPRLYVAANSGARIGLSESVKKAFKVAFKDPSKPENGFSFLYVTKEDYERLDVANNSIITELVTLNGEEVYKITDIIGTEQDLGVENLKGSGMIAGETSIAYNDIFTLTIVLGRYVYMHCIIFNFFLHYLCQTELLELEHTSYDLVKEQFKRQPCHQSF